MHDFIFFQNYFFGFAKSPKIHFKKPANAMEQQILKNSFFLKYMNTQIKKSTHKHKFKTSTTQDTIKHVLPFGFSPLGMTFGQCQ